MLIVPCLAPLQRAAAEVPSFEQMEEARQDFQRGVERFRAHDFRAAEERFRRARVASASVLYDLAVTLELEARWTEAADTWQSLAREAPARLKHSDALAEHIRELRDRGRLRSEDPARSLTSRSLRYQLYHDDEDEDRLLGLSGEVAIELPRAAPSAAPPTSVEEEPARHQSQPVVPGPPLFPPRKSSRLADSSGTAASEQQPAPDARRESQAPGRVSRRVPWWVWVVVGGAAAAGVGVGVGVAVAGEHHGPQATDLGSIGPGALTVRY